MNVIRMVTTEEGESRFTEIDIPMENVEQIFGETVPVGTLLPARL